MGSGMWDAWTEQCTRLFSYVEHVTARSSGCDDDAIVNARVAICSKIAHSSPLRNDPFCCTLHMPRIPFNCICVDQSGHVQGTMHRNTRAVQRTACTYCLRVKHSRDNRLYHTWVYTNSATLSLNYPVHQNWGKMFWRLLQTGLSSAIFDPTPPRKVVGYPGGVATFVHWIA